MKIWRQQSRIPITYVCSISLSNLRLDSKENGFLLSQSGSFGNKILVVESKTPWPE